MRKIAVVLTLLAGLAAAAWVMLGREGAGSSVPGGSGSAAQGETPLAFVPADTPYLFANLGPFPAEAMQAFAEQSNMMKPVWQAYFGMVTQELERTEANASAAKWLRAFQAELESLAPMDMLKSAGYDPSGNNHAALYGMGLVPVARLTLSDPQAFRAFVQRIEQRSGETLPRGDIDGQAYWMIAPEGAKLRGIMAVQGAHLVLTLAPVGDDAPLRTLLGIERPTQPLRDGGKLAELNQRHGLLPVGSGYIDSARLVSLLLASPSPLETAFLTAIGVEKPDIDPLCKTEFAALAQVAPHLVSGYTRFDAKRMDMKTHIELRSDIAQDLMQLRAPMPGLAQTDDAMFNFGISLKLAALPPLVNKWAASVASAPWQCPALSDLNDSFAQSREQISNPAVFAAAPVFHGLHIIATKLVLKTGNEQPEFSGKLLLGSPNPAALIGMAKSFVPQLAELSLSPDGAVHPLPALPEMPIEAPVFVAMTDAVLGLAVGEGEDGDLRSFMQTDPKRQPLLVFGYGGALFTEMSDTMQKAILEEGSAASQEEAQQMAEMIKAAYGLVRHVEFRFELDEQGISLHQSAVFN